MTSSLREHREDFPVTRPIATRWADNDHYGHVNNVVYYSYFDTAVNGWLIESTGLDIRELDEIGIVVSSTCEYRQPISFPDELEVGLSVRRVGTSSVTYRLVVFVVGQDAPRAVGEFVHVYVDAATRKPTPIPQVVRAALAALPPAER